MKRRRLNGQRQLRNDMVRKNNNVLITMKRIRVLEAKYNKDLPCLVETLKKRKKELYKGSVYLYDKFTNSRSIKTREQRTTTNFGEKK